MACSRDSHACPCHDTTSTMLYRWGCMLGIFCSCLFFSTLLLSHHLDKGSSLSPLSINTVPKLFWLTFFLFWKLQSCLSIFGPGQRFASSCVASVILCQNLLRTVDCQSIASAFWKLLVILQTCLLGFIFTAFKMCLSSTTAVFSADLVVLGCWCRWWFPNSWFVHALCFCYIALIDFLFSFSIQIACFSLKVSSLIFILVCVCHRRMQD